MVPAPREMHRQYPHLSMAQVYAALAYYYDHQLELDQQLDQQMRQYERQRSAAGDSPGKTKLRRQGLL